MNQILNYLSKNLRYFKTITKYIIKKDKIFFFSKTKNIETKWINVLNDDIVLQNLVVENFFFFKKQFRQIEKNNENNKF